VIAVDRPGHGFGRSVRLRACRPDGRRVDVHP
jgi:hypothetical protein